MESLLSETFFIGRMEMLSRPNGFMLYDKLEVASFSTSELLHPNMKDKLRLIRARSNFYMIRDNPDVSPANVDCPFNTLRIALKDEYHKKIADMLAYTSVAYNYL